MSASASASSSFAATNSIPPEALEVKYDRTDYLKEMSKREPNQVVLTTDQKRRIGNYLQLHIGRLLGSGSYGYTYHVCKDRYDCRVAMKLIPYQYYWQQPILDSEFEILKTLRGWELQMPQGTKLNYLNPNDNEKKPESLKYVSPLWEGSFVTTDLYEYWDIPVEDLKLSKNSQGYVGFGVLLMELMDDDLNNFVQYRAQEVAFRPRLPAYLKYDSLYTKGEIKQMFALAIQMGMNGLVHGDLQPQQFLIRQPFYQNSIKKLLWQSCTKLLVGDFGFAGWSQDERERQNVNLVARMGWTGRHYGIDEIPALYALTTYRDAIVFNVWQMLVFFLVLNPNLVFPLWDEDKKEILLFGGIANFVPLMQQSNIGQLYSKRNEKKMYQDMEQGEARVRRLHHRPYPVWMLDLSYFVGHPVTTIHDLPRMTLAPIIPKEPNQPKEVIDVEDQEKSDKDPDIDLTHDDD